MLPGIVRQIGAAKLAGAVDTVFRTVGLVADDAATLAFKQLMRTGDKALAVPQLADKVQQINDPTYEANPQLGMARKVMRILAKTAALNATRTPQSPETGAYWEVDMKRPGMNFVSNGPGFKADMANEATSVATGDSPKYGAAGNTQEALAATPMLEAGLPRLLTGTSAGGDMNLDPRAAASSAFDRLRAFMRDANPPMNIGPGQEVDLGERGPA